MASFVRTSTMAPTTNFSIRYSLRTVSPYRIQVYSESETDFITSFEVTFGQHPVLILQVKPPQDLSLNSTREAANWQIRRRLVDLSEYATLPVLFSISAIGTKLCFYELEKELGRMTPLRIPGDPNFMIDVVPKEQWDCDVLEADGEQRLRALATQITEACERL